MPQAPPTPLHRRVPMRGRVALLVIGCAVTAGTTGCTHSPSADTPTPTTTTQAGPVHSATTTPPSHEAPTSEELAARSYAAIIRRYYVRLEHPSPDDVQIARDHTGASEQATREKNRQLAFTGQRADFTHRDPPAPTIGSVLVRDSIATIQNCMLDDATIVDDAGAVVDDTVARYQLRSVLVKAGGRWRLSEQTILNRSVDGQGCER